MAAMTRPSPFAARLFALQISARPEDAEELETLEDWARWKASGGPKGYDAKRAAELNRQMVSHYKLLAKLEKM